VRIESTPPDRSARLWLGLTSRLIIHTLGCGRLVHTSIVGLTAILRPLPLLTHGLVVSSLTIAGRGAGRHALVVHHGVDVRDPAHSIVVAQSVLTDAAMGVHSFNQILLVQLDAPVAFH